ncbi:MAG: hypothetical protein EB015_13355 [Methylocystaceae bacterium]|nr:hypothetical protein [Methylocystaceae bacterium]
MPVDYTIASRNALANTPTDFTNMLAQYQMMGARAQQQQLQQRELDRQNQLVGLLGGADINSPETINMLARAGYLPESISVMTAQRQAEAQRAAAEAQRANAAYHMGMLGIQREKLPLEKEGRLNREALAKADSADLDLLTKRTGIAQDLLSRMDETNYPDLKNEVAKFDPTIASHLGGTYNQKQVSKYLNTAESIRKQIESEQARRAESEKVTTTTPEWAKGLVLQTTPSGRVSLTAPTQPMMPQNAMTPAPVMPQTAFTNAPPVQPMQPAEMIGTPEYEIRRTARAVLDVAGFDPEKKINYVADLIKDTPSSAFRAYAQQQAGAFKGEATPQMENVGRLNTIIDNMVLAAVNNKLGGQVSDADVKLLQRAKASINDPSVQPNQRLAAWDEVMRIQAKQAGYDYTPMTKEQIRGKPIIGDRQPAQADEESILTSVFGPKKK